MPIPKPKRYERKNKFITRCAFTGNMIKEFPNIKQRFAICYNKLRYKK